MTETADERLRQAVFSSPELEGALRISFAVSAARTKSGGSSSAM